MFKSDELIYIQLQKTACSHIAKLLMQLLAGEMIGKHNRALPEQLQSDIYFLGSIRNPWDWYLSLWTFGVGKKGALFEELTQRNILFALKYWLKNPINGHQLLQQEIGKNVKLWRSFYTKSDDVMAFRLWLKHIHQTKLTQTINPNFGLMTNRYLNLYCAENVAELTKINQIQALYDFDKRNCYIDYFIRQEALEHSLIEALKPIKTLTKSEQDIIFNAAKTNTSNRAFAMEDYYDKPSIALVQRRDALIIEKFDYQNPSI